METKSKKRKEISIEKDSLVEDIDDVSDENFGEKTITIDSNDNISTKNNHQTLSGYKPRLAALAEQEAILEIDYKDCEELLSALPSTSNEYYSLVADNMYIQGKHYSSAAL